ncbi:MAG: hypothetical protein ACK5L3_13690 [Oscillospiraceae bacterium]
MNERRCPYCNDLLDPAEKCSCPDAKAARAENEQPQGGEHVA